MTTIQANQDGAEDVNDFLQRIREQNNNRDREDEERTIKLEEEILKARKERQARRAERARSLSPTKDSPSSISEVNRAVAPQPEASSLDQSLQSSMQSPSTTRPIASRELVLNDALQRLTDSSPSSPLPDTRDTDLHRGHEPRVEGDMTDGRTVISRAEPDTNAALSHGPPLSWQRRPDAKPLTGPRALPPTRAAARNASARSPVSSTSAVRDDETEMSRSDIAQSLGSKDPSWFKQTADRGGSSAAYRRNEGYAEATPSSSERRLPLPGITPDPTSSQRGQLSPALGAAQTPPEPHGSTVRGSTSAALQRSNHTPTTLSASTEMKSPLPASAAQRFEPPSMDATARSGEDHPSRMDRGRNVTMGSPAGCISAERAERSMSPTKGLGGFVQSAMMKRSDSVNKRWSAQPNAGLARADSVASNRSGHGHSGSVSGPFSPPGQAYSRSNTRSRETSPVSTSRPGSSRGNNGTLVSDQKENQRPKTPESRDHPQRSDGGFVRPALPSHSRSHSVMSPSEGAEEGIARLQIRTTPPASPTKYDSKRWSPTKSSWLESALNKPDSPKPKAAPNTQPAWMADMGRARKQSTSSETSNHKEVSTGGLMRVPPIGGFPKAAPSVAFASSGVSSNDNDTAKKASSADEASRRAGNAGKCTNSTSSPTKAASLASSPISPEPRPQPKTVTTCGPPTAAASPSSTTPSLPPLSKAISTPSPPATKPKPTSTPPLDFRSSLKSRSGLSTAAPSSAPEFQQVFGKLKRTTTQNYVAPDVLKDNILRGKSQLNVTGGPKKSERRDEFLESVLKKKEEMAAKKGEGGVKSGVGAAREVETPEALLKRERLAKASRDYGSGSVERETPEAIARRQTLRRGANSPSTGKDEPPKGLAGRFNPALASVLARGPPSASSTGESAGRAASVASAASTASSVSVASSMGSGSSLTHPTKGRPRGPKRRLPSEKA